VTYLLVRTVCLSTVYLESLRNISCGI